jgi:hypothetical protein
MIPRLMAQRRRTIIKTVEVEVKRIQHTALLLDNDYNATDGICRLEGFAVWTLTIEKFRERDERRRGGKRYVHTTEGIQGVEVSQREGIGGIADNGEIKGG